MTYRPDIIAAIKANRAADEPLGCKALAKACGVSVEILYRAAKRADVFVAVAPRSKKTGTIRARPRVGKMKWAGSDCTITAAMLRRAKLENEKSLAFEIADGVITLRAASSHPNPRAA